MLPWNVDTYIIDTTELVFTVSKRTSIVQAACAGFFEVATKCCLVLDICHLILVVCLFKGVLILVLLRLLRLLVVLLVLKVAFLRTITIVGSVVAIASTVLLWEALGVGLLLVIILSLLVVFTVTSTVFSRTLACAFRLTTVVINAIILHIVTATILLV